jgi:DNA-binding NarL/FixJ family response regulator
MDPIRIVLVDDHEVVRAGIKAMIDAQDDMEVVGEAGTVEDAVRRVGYDEPDVVVLDVRLPDGSGVEACRDIRDRFPDVKGDPRRRRWVRSQAGQGLRPGR